MLEEKDKNFDKYDETSIKIVAIEDVLKSYDEKIDNLDKILSNFKFEKEKTDMSVKCRECESYYEKKKV